MMWMWILIMGALLIAFIAGFVYLTSRFSRFEIIGRLSKGRKGRRRLLSMVPLVLIVAVLWITMGYMNAVVVLLHLVVVWLIGDLIALLITKLRGKDFKRYYVGGVVIVFTAAYLCVGWYLAHNVWRTDYTITTDKNIGSIRIVLFSDSHVGTTFDGDDWKQYIDRMNKEDPDVILITGDFVDDDTSREDMIKSCEAMGDLQTKYGVYFSFGNHDKGYYDKSYRGYDGDDLISELKKNNVVVLQDEKVLIDNRFYIIGRQDRSEEQRDNSRDEMETLTRNLDKTKFSIVMDHQPYDYEAESEAQVDLVLSGHTHGGQLIPINHVGEWTGENAKAYGYEKRKDTNFIVTSGISDWAIKFKTGCKSEYVVIDVNENNR